MQIEVDETLARGLITAISIVDGDYLTNEQYAAVHELCSTLEAEFPNESPSYIHVCHKCYCRFASEFTESDYDPDRDGTQPLCDDCDDRQIMRDNSV